MHIDPQHSHISKNLSIFTVVFFFVIRWCFCIPSPLFLWMFYTWCVSYEIECVALLQFSFIKFGLTFIHDQVMSIHWVVLGLLAPSTKNLLMSWKKIDMNSEQFFVDIWFVHHCVFLTILISLTCENYFVHFQLNYIRRFFGRNFTIHLHILLLSSK